ncbi:MAG: LysR family transcriptional regulator [Acidobacteriota bacterium]|jgi:DNA-binding transcriptional LysR family regulator|nr:LysR family transcriptional regulator [Bryobacteraceae bacterium CoA2 C42]MCA2963018.1 LysR family transcriptional regulator [Acidobacteriaceae bacterium]
MELYSLRVFQAVITEKSFSRAAEKLSRTQPAISLAVQRLEQEIGEKLIDRSGKELLLTDAGRIAFDFARRFDHLISEMNTALAEMRDNSAGVLIVGANESTSLYVLQHIVRYRRLYPKVKVRVRRSLSSKIPSQLIDGELELGVISFDPQDDRLKAQVIFTDHLAFVVSPEHRLARRSSVSITELGMETFIAHNVLSPYREVVLREFQRHRVPLNMDVEMPTVETIRQMVQRNEGVAFLPKMCVDAEIERGLLREVRVEELSVARKVHLVYPARRALSHAARAFLDVVKGERILGENGETPATS